MKQKKRKRLLSLLVTLAMVIGLMQGMTLTAYAQPACPECGNYTGKTDPNTFYDFTGIDGTYMCMNPSHGDAGLTIPAAQADRVPNDEDRWSTNQTITANKEIQDGVEVTADITLTINEGATLTVNRGINAKGHTLTVKGPGKLVVYGAAGKSGANGADGGVGAKIEDQTSDGGPGGGGNPGEAGGNGGDAITGNLVVEGGATVEATGSDGGAGGNGGKGGTGGESVVVEAGGFSCYGGNGGDGGIGGKGGDGGSGIVGNVTVKSGSLTATAGSAGAGGKGGDGGTGGYSSFGGNGGNGADGGNGGNGGIGITGTVTVTGGWVIAAGGVGAKGGAAGARGEGGEGFTPANHGDPGSAGQNAGSNGSVGSAVSGTITGKAQGSDDNSAWTDITSGSTSTKQYVKVESAHTHSFTYSASGDTITATCSTAECPLTESKATLTIVKPTQETYGQTGEGISANATLTGLSDFNTATSKAIAATEIKYVGRDGTTYAESATAPTNAGTYTAKITVEGQTASVDYEIAKAAGSISYTTASVNKAYGDAAFTNELTKTGDGTVSYASDKTSVATVNSETGEVTIVGVGEANITATVADSDNSTYETKTASYTLTVSAKSMTVSAEGYTGAYDGNPHSITVNITEPASGTTIAYGTTEGTYDLTANPEITNVSDSKTIYFKVTAPNYADYTGSAAVTISKADQDAPAAPTEDSVSVNSITLKTITNGEYKMGDGDTWQESPTFTGLTKNTEYSFYQRLKEDANHKASPASTPVAINTADHTHQWSYAAGTGDGADTITATCADTDGGHGTPKTATLTIKAPARTTYGGSESAEATIEGSIDGVDNPSIVYKKGNNSLDAAPTDAGSYTASITLGNATASVTYSIARKAVTVSDITASEKIYDGTTEATLVTTGASFAGKLDSDNLTVSATGTFENANVGEGKNVTISGLTLDGTSKENYVLADEGQQTIATANITAKEVGLTWSNTELTYNGEAQKPTATATGLVDGDTCTVTVTGEQTNAGENYTATAESLSNSNYKLPENKTTAFKITKADAVAATVTANNRTYDGTEKPLVNVDNSTLVGGEMQYALGENATTAPAENLYSTSIPTGTDMEDYYVWYMVTGDSNHYDTSPVCVTAEIKPVDVTGVTLNKTSATLNVGEEETLKATVSPENATHQDLVWNSSKPGVVTVDGTGKIKAVEAGTSTITVTATNGTEDTADDKTASCVVTVKKGESTTDPGETKDEPETKPDQTEKAKQTAQKQTFAMNSGLKVIQKGKTIQVKWGKVAGADGYEVYIQYCGKKFQKKAAVTVKASGKTTVKTKKINGKKLNLKKNFKVVVKAYQKKNGKNATLCKTITAHVVGKNNRKFTNVKKVVLKKSSYSLKVGKTAQIKAQYKLVDPKKKELTDRHAPTWRYLSTDKKVAKVAKNGKIKAVGKGTCTIWVYARNGFAKKAKITVK